MYKSQLSIFKKILYISWILLLPFLVIVQGYIWGVGGPNYFTNVFSIIVIFMLSVFYGVKGIKVGELNCILLVLIFSCWATTYSVFLGGSVNDDIQALTRSVVLFTFIYIFLKHQNQDVNTLIVKVLFILWASISCLIFLSAVLKVGLQTYPNFNSGWKFYFPATNELSYIYFSTFLVVNYYLKSFYTRIFAGSITVVTFLTIGTKVFIPLLASFLLLTCISYARQNKYKLTFFITLLTPILSLILLVTYFEQIATFIAEALIGSSGGAGTLENKIIVRGVTSAILGERDILIGLALEYIDRTYSMIDILFGKTISVYSAEFAVYRGLRGPGWIENDIMDLLCAYGVLGLCSYLAILYKLSNLSLLFNFSKKFNKLDELKLMQCATLFLGGALSGHVLFFTFPMFITALVLGLGDSD